jgi:hypothetical protein
MPQIKSSAPIWAIVLLFCTSFMYVSSALPESRLEERLRQDIRDNRLDDFRRVEAAFILSGATDPDSLDDYLFWYSNLLNQIKDYHFDPFDRIGSAGKVFSYLHATWLLKYKEEATTLVDIVRNKQFNCVAATILYNLMCDDLGWSTQAFETPTHTYTIFTNFTERVMVENTTTMGFDIMRNLNEYSHYLAQFYPRNQVLKIGLDRLYAYENSNGRVIDNTELLGLLAYNRAYFAKRNGDFKTAYDFVLLAQSFNRDSRSNINFEIDLYFRWGQKVYDEGQYEEAFDVLTHGFYRHPDNRELANNCRIAFFNALKKNWEQKNWEVSRRLTNEMWATNLLNDEDTSRLQAILHNWATLNYQQKIKRESLEAIELLEKIDAEDPRLADLKAAVIKLPEK